MGIPHDTAPRPTSPTPSPTKRSPTSPTPSPTTHTSPTLPTPSPTTPYIAYTANIASYVTNAISDYAYIAYIAIATTTTMAPRAGS